MCFRGSIIFFSVFCLSAGFFKGAFCFVSLFLHNQFLFLIHCLCELKLDWSVLIYWWPNEWDFSGAAHELFNFNFIYIKFNYIYYNNFSCISNKSQTCEKLLKIIAGFLYITCTFVFGLLDRCMMLKTSLVILTC